MSDNIRAKLLPVCIELLREHSPVPVGIELMCAGTTLLMRAGLSIQELCEMISHGIEQMEQREATNGEN